MVEQVGLHSPLRAAAEEAMQKLLDRGSVADSLGVLFWSPACGDAVFEALSKSLKSISHLSPSQVSFYFIQFCLVDTVSEILRYFAGHA